MKFSSRLLRIAAENAVRLFLVSLTIIIAVHYPYFGVLLGSVGGLTDTFQSYIVPSLICLRIHGDSGENVMMTVALYKLITCFGALIMLYTLGSILMNLLAVPI